MRQTMLIREDLPIEPEELGFDIETDPEDEDEIMAILEMINRDATNKKAAPDVQIGDGKKKEVGKQPTSIITKTGGKSK